MTGNSAGSLSEPTLRRVVIESRASGLTPSPADWRDVWIYFLMVDRFNRRDAPLLTTFGTLWSLEGLGVEWPSGDWSILHLLVFYAVIAVSYARIERRRVVAG